MATPGDEISVMLRMAADAGNETDEGEIIVATGLDDTLLITVRGQTLTLLPEDARRLAGVLRLLLGEEGEWN